MKTQTINEIESFHSQIDPWGYETNPHDERRKATLLGEIANIAAERSLDIGCGQGFITRDLPGKSVIGVDISANAIQHAQKFANDRIQFVTSSIYDLDKNVQGKFDLIVITGVLYPEYIGNSNTLIYQIIDGLLADKGTLVSVHIGEWYKSRFPYLMTKSIFYPYREYQHVLEVYRK